jgi:DNA-binding response OmpR family regulator
MTYEALADDRSSGQAHATQPARIVIVDDDASYLDLMQEFLQTEGYEVLTHREWGSAQEYILQVRPDLVILDLIMGRETRGWSILDTLRTVPETASISVIVCSADVPSLNDHEELLGRYGVRPLTKPFDLDYLLNTIADSLGRTSATRIQ